MNKQEYGKAYTEVLAVINSLSKQDVQKIPKSEIDFYAENMDKSYDFKIDLNLPIERQGLSKKASVVLVSIFMKYFLTSQEKEKFKNILKRNDKK